MSLNTWRKEFYKIGANRVENLKDALKHSIRKWTGLLPENMSKHNITRGKDKIWHTPYINDNNLSMDIDSISCALCNLCPDCQDCPIYIVTNKTCDETDSPYMKYLHGSDARAMLALLKKVQKEWKKD